MIVDEDDYQVWTRFFKKIFPLKAWPITGMTLSAYFFVLALSREFTANHEDVNRGFFCLLCDYT